MLAEPAAGAGAGAGLMVMPFMFACDCRGNSQFFWESEVEILCFFGIVLTLIVGASFTRQEKHDASHI